MCPLVAFSHQVDCKIVDFRSFHPFHHVGTQHIVNELYLKDMRLQLALWLRYLQRQCSVDLVDPFMRPRLDPRHLLISLIQQTNISWTAVTGLQMSGTFKLGCHVPMPSKELPRSFPRF